MKYDSIKIKDHHVQSKFPEGFKPIHEMKSKNHRTKEKFCNNTLLETLNKDD